MFFKILTNILNFVRFRCLAAFERDGYEEFRGKDTIFRRSYDTSSYHATQNTWVGFSSWRFSVQIFMKKCWFFSGASGGDYLIWSSLSGCSSYVHSNRSKILPRSIKKNHRLFLKTKKVRDTFRKFLIFFRSKNRNFSNFEIFRSHKFRKCSLKIEWKWKFSRLENFRFFDLKIFKKNEILL